MDSAKRANYLKLMGIDVFVPKYQPSQDSVTPESIELSHTNEVVEESSNQVSEELVAESKSGLSWLAQAENSPLLVVLPNADKPLAPEPRQLLVKMLQAIGVKAADCDYVAVVGDAQSATADPDYSRLQGVIVFGKRAGDHMVLNCGARRVPGESYFQINGKPMIVTLHPKELLDTPELKRQAWTDLKLLNRLMH